MGVLDHGPWPLSMQIPLPLKGHRERLKSAIFWARHVSVLSLTLSISGLDTETSYITTPT